MGPPSHPQLSGDILQHAKPFNGFEHSGAEVKVMLPIIQPSNNLHLETESNEVNGQ